MTTPTFDPTTDLNGYMTALGQKARQATRALRLACAETKSIALTAMAHEIEQAEEEILAANRLDLEGGKNKGLSAAMMDRLKLDTARIEGIANGLRAIAALPETIGTVDETWTQPNGLKFSKVRVPLGVIGMIYESRPNVTADAGGLCVKSGNACILRGGSESSHSSAAIHKALTRGLETAGLPKTAIQMIATTDRAAVGHLLGGLGGHVDLIIPRGGKSLIARVQNDARVPVLAHLEGLCHTYVHKGADMDKAKDILLNAKMRRTGVCGSTETLLVDNGIADKFVPMIANALTEVGCELRGDESLVPLSDHIKLASEDDYYTEHLAPILNLRRVENTASAIAHIAKYGSGHTDAIVTEDEKAAAQFLAEVDSAIVMHNTSTQFADGGEFGFGAEIGIATGRLHARGPVGAQHLTTYKYTVEGDGQTRP